MVEQYSDYYKARYVQVNTPQQLTLDTEGDSLDNDIVLQDEPQALVLTLNASQYQELLSSALNGAETTFPERYIEVIYPLLKAGKIVFCDQVAQCISDNANTQSSLLNLISNIGTVPTDEDTTENPIDDSLWNNEEIIPSSWTCDRDHAFGMARAILNEMHNAAIQLINLLETATNIPELIAVFIDNVEVVSWFGSLLELGTWLQQQVLETYEAAWAQETVRDELACSLYCLIYENCHLTVGMLDEWYQGELPSLPTDLSDYKVILDWALDLDLSIDKGAVVVWHWLGLQAIRFRSRWPSPLTAGLRSWSVIGALAADDTDPDWSVLCTECPAEWREIFNFAGGDTRWLLSARPKPSCSGLAGVYVAGFGWAGTYTNCGFGVPSYQIQIRPPVGVLGGPNLIRRVIIEYAVADTEFPGILYEFEARTGGAVTYSTGEVTDSPDGAFGRIVIDVTGSHDNVSLWLRGGIHEPENPARQKYITKVILSGVGDNPYV